MLEEAAVFGSKNSVDHMPGHLINGNQSSLLPFRSEEEHELFRFQFENRDGFPGAGVDNGLYSGTGELD